MYYRTEKIVTTSTSPVEDDGGIQFLFLTTFFNTSVYILPYFLLMEVMG